MMGVGVGCMDEKHITFDDRKKNALHLTMGGGEEVRIKVIRTRVYLKAAAEDKTVSTHCNL